MENMFSENDIRKIIRDELLKLCQNWIEQTVSSDQSCNDCDASNVEAYISKVPFCMRCARDRFLGGR